MNTFCWGYPMSSLSQAKITSLNLSLFIFNNEGLLLAFGSEEAKVQLSLVVQNLGSHSTSHLHQAAETRAQRDQSRTPEVHQWGSRCHILPGPLGLSTEKVDDDIAKATSDRQGLG